MSLSRRCSRTACQKAAIATLTYVYADQTAVVGPLATYAEPHTYDLCSQHATGLTAPRGWDVVRLATDFPEPQPTTDDLLALADAVREAVLAALADGDAIVRAHAVWAARRLAIDLPDDLAGALQADPDPLVRDELAREDVPAVARR